MLHDEVDRQALQGRKLISEPGDDDILDIRPGEHLRDRGLEVLEHDDRACAAVAELVLEFAGRIKRVDVDDHEPGPQYAEHDHHGLQQVGQHHRDAVTGFQAEYGLQVGGEIPAQSVDVGKAERRAAIREGRALGEALEAVAEHFRQRRVAVRIDLGGHAARITRNPGFIPHISPVCKRFGKVLSDA